MSDPVDKLYGIGPVRAAQLAAVGVHTIRDLEHALESGKVTLLDASAFALRYYTDLRQRIPRTMTDQIWARLSAKLHAVDAEIIAEVAGSYRRGAATSGDIDIIASTKTSMIDFVNGLADDQQFVGALAVGPTRATFLYRCVQVCQVDLLIVPRENYVPALLYFTGSGDFNERMRAKAKAAGYRLNQLGLWRLSDNHTHKFDGKTYARVDVQTEQDIFAAIGMKYVEPQDRI